LKMMGELVKLQLPIAILILLFSVSHAMFLVGNISENGKVSVLCEGEGIIYLSMPDGNVAALRLENNHQVALEPTIGGPYTVQCGNETKTFIANLAKNPDEITAQGDAGGTVALFIILITGLFLIASVAVFLLMRSRTEFIKSVSGGKARITLVSGMDLHGIEIEDPVYMGAKEQLRFSIAHLSPGQKWAHEYEIAQANKALPASLTANSSKGKISLLSMLEIEGGTPPKPLPGRRDIIVKKALPKST
jgi:hypothetical protein